MSTLTKQLFRSLKVLNPICRWLIMLTRGPNSAQPCPICCVPEEYLDAIDLSFRHRDTVACRDIYEKALLAEMEAEANHICKAYGICKVKVLYILGPMDYHISHF